MPEIAEGSLNSVILECHKHMDIKLAEMLMLQSEGYNIWTEDLNAEEVDSVDIYAMYVYIPYKYRGGQTSYHSNDCCSCK